MVKNKMDCKTWIALISLCVMVLSGIFGFGKTFANLEAQSLKIEDAKIEYRQHVDKAINNFDNITLKLADLKDQDNEMDVRIARIETKLDMIGDDIKSIKGMMIKNESRTAISKIN